MAKALLKRHPDEVGAVDDLEDILYTIVNDQNFQVHQFRTSQLSSHGSTHNIIVGTSVVAN